MNFIPGGAVALTARRSAAVATKRSLADSQHVGGKGKSRRRREKRILTGLEGHVVGRLMKTLCDDPDYPYL